MLLEISQRTQLIDKQACHQLVGKSQQPRAVKMLRALMDTQHSAAHPAGAVGGHTSGSSWSMHISPESQRSESQAICQAGSECHNMNKLLMHFQELVSRLRKSNMNMNKAQHQELTSLHHQLGEMA